MFEEWMEATNKRPRISRDSVRGKEGRMNSRGSMALISGIISFIVFCVLFLLLFGMEFGGLGVLGAAGCGIGTAFANYIGGR